MKADQIRRKFFDGVPRYEWIETLGQGGVGIVYKAKDLELDEVVAIKVLSPDIAKEDEVVLARFKREINLNRKIKHPNVARMYDFGISGEYPYITMEVVPGKDLWTMIRDEGRLPPPKAVPILRQIARGCSAIHELGIVHRDLKSQNVIVDEQGAVAIVDFGLARWNLGGGFTLDSIILGTPQYMSPEQASGKAVRRREERRLLDRDHRVRGPDRAAAVHGRQPDRGRDDADQRPRPGPPPEVRGRLSGPARGRPEGAPEGPREEVCHGGRPRGRPR